MTRALALAAVLALSGCASTLPVVRSYEGALRERIHKAKHLGAMACAPAELARAQASYRFAVREIEEGELGRAADHLDDGLAAIDRALLQGPTCAVRAAPVRDPAADPWLDGDGDAVPDDRDACPYSIEDLDGHADGDGCPDPDDDGDGAADAADACPAEAEDRDGWQDEDGCPDLDDDADAIPDSEDSCPRAAETVNGVDDDDGCPDFAPRHSAIEGDHLRLLRPVDFAEGTPVLLGTSHEALREVAAILTMNPTWRLRVEGHTDNRGAAEAQKALSAQRARAVLDFLVAEKVATERLTSEGIGGANPVTTNRTEDGRRANNRIELILTR